LKSSCECGMGLVSKLIYNIVLYTTETYSTCISERFRIYLILDITGIFQMFWSGFAPFDNAVLADVPRIFPQHKINARRFVHSPRLHLMILHIPYSCIILPRTLILSPFLTCCAILPTSFGGKECHLGS